MFNVWTSRNMLTLPIPRTHGNHYFIRNWLCVNMENGKWCLTTHAFILWFWCFCCSSVFTTASCLINDKNVYMLWDSIQIIAWQKMNKWRLIYEQVLPFFTTSLIIKCLLITSDHLKYIKSKRTINRLKLANRL